MTLIDKILSQDYPSRRLDHEIHILFFVPDDKKGTIKWNHYGSYSWALSPNHIVFDEAPAYTTSVDAAIELAERVLNLDRDDSFSGLILEANRELSRKYSWAANFSTQQQRQELPIQLCVAILKAKGVSPDITRGVSN